MPDRMLLLTRLFMRLDGVLVRVRDTRIYVDFNTGKVTRDYTEREDDFEKVKKAGLTFLLFSFGFTSCQISIFAHESHLSFG